MAMMADFKAEMAAVMTKYNVEFSYDIDWNMFEFTIGGRNDEDGNWIPYEILTIRDCGSTIDATDFKK